MGFLRFHDQGEGFFLYNVIPSCMPWLWCIIVKKYSEIRFYWPDQACAQTNTWLIRL